MRIFLATWTDAAWHPVVRFTSQVLSERGDTVDILYRQPNPGHVIPGGADFGAHVALHPFVGGRSGWRDKVDYARFLAQAFVFGRQLMPDVVIGYDMYGLAAAYCAGIARPSTKLVYHNLDLVGGGPLGVLGRGIERLEQHIAQRACQTIFSSPGRAAIFKRKARLKRDPLVVMNCQRRNQPQQQTGELRQLLHERGLEYDRLIVRLGSIGPDHGIEATIESMLHWEGNWGLILAGMPIESYLNKLRALIVSLGLSQRVVILPSVSYSLWYDCLYSADLGIALYESNGNINHATMAGAGNKLNLYLKAGIPCLVPEVPDFVAFIAQYHAGQAVNASDPEAIATAVNTLFADSKKYANLCYNARHAFETVFNFETQYEPFLHLLDTWGHNSRSTPEYAQD
jgi:glycosyltransferase involved in cell wall biosynthesis